MSIDADLLDVVSQLGPDEQRVLAFLAKRLHDGQRCYGRLDLASDTRDFHRERAMEIADVLVYSAFIELRRTTRQA